MLQSIDWLWLLHPVLAVAVVLSQGINLIKALAEMAAQEQLHSVMQNRINK